MKKFSSIGVTTAVIKEYVAYMTRELKTNVALQQKIKQDFELSEAIELDAIETKGSLCKVGGHEVTDSFLEVLQKNPDPVVLKEIMTDNFFDYEAMKAVGCSVYSVFIGIAEESGNVAKMLSLKDTIKNLHKFGSASAYGHALTGGLKDTKDLYVLKTPVSEGTAQDSLHELFIGLLVMNNMRKYCPNFVFTYGGFRCASPQIDPKTKEVKSWCMPHDVKIPYVIYEPITPSMSFGTYVEKCSIPQFYSLWFQFLFSTDIASEKFGWTHYDAHDGNFLVEEIDVAGLGKRFSIPYPTRGGKSLYVASERRLVAIDFGQSTVNYNGRAHTMRDKGLRAYGMRNGPHPLHDVYKLLMFLGASTKRANNMPVYRELEKLFRFFNDSETFASCLESQSPQKGYYYILPALDWILNYNIGNVIAYAESIWDVSNIVTTEPNFNVLECTSCYTFAGVLKESGTFSKNFVTSAHSFADFYDVATYLSKYAIDHYEELVKSFDYQKAKKDFVASIVKEIEVVQRLKNFEQATVLPGNIRALATAAAEKSHAQSQLNLYELVSAYEDVELMAKIGINVATIFQDAALIKEIKDYRLIIKNSEPAIRKQISQANLNYQKIHEIITMPKWLYTYERAFPWYSNAAGNVVGLKSRFNKDVNDLFVETRLPAVLLNIVPEKILITEEVEPVKPVVVKRVEGINIEREPKRNLYPDNPKLLINRARNGQVISLALADNVN